MIMFLSQYIYIRLVIKYRKMCVNEKKKNNNRRNERIPRAIEISHNGSPQIITCMYWRADNKDDKINNCERNI